MNSPVYVATILQSALCVLLVIVDVRIYTYISGARKTPMYTVRA